MYPFERFTERAKKVLTLAQEEAERSHHSYIGTEHLLLGLLREGSGVAAKVLDNLGVDLGRVRSAIQSVLGKNERILIQQIIPTSRVKTVIEIAFEEARRMGKNYVGTEHLLLGLLIEGEGIAAHVLQDLGATLETVRAELGRLLGESALEAAEEGESVGMPPPHRRDASPVWTLVGAASRIAADQHASVGPEHMLLALLDGDPLVRRMLGALGIDDAKLAELRRIATAPARLVDLRRTFERRVAELGGLSGWSGREPEPTGPGHAGARRRSTTPGGTETAELRRLRAELDEAERRWRAGEELSGGGPGRPDEVRGEELGAGEEGQGGDQAGEDVAGEGPPGE
ncbi:MAG TPA: Clp protease N-terminal domain-containing protein [Candidatus Binatia bacterium]|nr:Clp protease N-terminal domain-containing protein [Candidatus Binatia bacterium]